MTGNSRRKRFAFGLIIAFLLAGFFFGGLKVVDMVIMARTPPQAVAVVDHDATRLSMNTLDVYPYDGAHTQADFIIPEAGGGLWSGDHGFYVDIDLDNPPP
jgi:hypothetical protein